MNAARSLDSENAGHACIHGAECLPRIRRSRENPLRVLGRVRARRLILSYPEHKCFQQYTQGQRIPGIANSRYVPQEYPCKQLVACCAGPTPSQLSPTFPDAVICSGFLRDILQSKPHRVAAKVDVCLQVFVRVSQRRSRQVYSIRIIVHLSARYALVSRNISIRLSDEFLLTTGIHAGASCALNSTASGRLTMPDVGKEAFLNGLGALTSQSRPSTLIGRPCTTSDAPTPAASRAHQLVRSESGGDVLGTAAV